ncbi:hypothetical protein C479_06492 [Halovivax asiaticus JCM 14624]|uniref:Uncharacterized protein n=1 Tax=Halovivax asiaticus JCM 14624 TaxID=1227490 RepID=M0BMG7_9EURY|nr:hypothetical protein [Halovivax asiaticus]ELZ11682.1 hypothetical protein C479_06492 [Halovivax asiaticus JCM 14624]
MDSGSHRSPVSFEQDGAIVRVGDDIERAELRIEIDGASGLEPALPDVFLFPVDEAVSVTVSQLRLEETFGQTLWDANGNQIGTIADGISDVPRGTYYASLTGAVKLHLRIEDATLWAEEHLDETGRSIVEMRFEEPTSVAIGARSLRSHPTATITVPDDPRALLDALPYLAASIKEHTCERSWPTIRQHPPALERGEQLEVPTELRAPETGIEIRIPPTYEHCYRVAPLAFYLGADVSAGESPALVLENGHVEPLKTRRADLAERVGDLLDRCLLLDSLVREAGYQPMGNAEYERLAPQLPFYPPNLYDLPPADQLLEYLEVPREVLDPFTPCWPKRAVLRPNPEDVAVLPSLLHELARIDVAHSPDAIPPTVPSDSTTGGGRDRGGEKRRSDALLTAHTFPAQVPGTCRLHPEAMERARTVERPTPDGASLTLATVDSARARSFRQFADQVRHETAVTVLEQPTAAALRDAVEADRTALYCENPTTEAGIHCADRTLPFDELGAVGSPVVWLADVAPGVTGEALVSAGAIAGILCDEPANQDAVFGALDQLCAGFSVADAVYTADVDRAVDVRFVGDASVTIVRRVSKTPTVVDVRSVDEDRYAFTIRSYPTDVVRQGTAVKPVSAEDVVGRVLEECNHDGYWLIGADAKQALPITTAEVASLVENDGFTVRLDGRLLTTADIGECPLQEVVQDGP